MYERQYHQNVGNAVMATCAYFSVCLSFCLSVCFFFFLCFLPSFLTVPFSVSFQLSFPFFLSPSLRNNLVTEPLVLLYAVICEITRHISKTISRL